MAQTLGLPEEGRCVSPEWGSFPPVSPPRHPHVKPGLMAVTFTKQEIHFMVNTTDAT